MIERLVEKKGKRSTLLMPRIPVMIGSFADKLSDNAKRAGLHVYDNIVAIDSVPVQYFDEASSILKTRKGDSVNLSVIRDSRPQNIRTLLDTAGNIGFYQFTLDEADSLGILKEETKKYSFLSSFPAGVKKTGKQLDFYIQQFNNDFKSSNRCLQRAWRL